MSGSSQLECVLVMPAYNEQDCIARVVKIWSDQFRKIFGANFKMVIVNDGSKDKTGALLDELKREYPELSPVHQKNGGHGAALLNAYRTGLSFNPKYIFHVDSDDQFDPGDFIKLWDKRNESKFILGYRMIRHDALHRLVITRILRAVLFCFFGAYLKDSNVPYRLIEARFLKSLLNQLPDTVFAPNIFLAVMAAKAGQNLMHIPVSHEDRKTGTVSIVRWKLIKVCLRSVRELFEFRWDLSRKIRHIKEAK